MKNDQIFLNESEKINGRKVVKKHVAAIHCSSKLGLVERKISNALLYYAFPTLRESLTHEITISELKSLLAANTRNHRIIKNALTKLMGTVIEWNLCNDDLPNDLEGWNASTILASVSVKNGVITYQYSEVIKSLLANPTMYGKINLAIQSRFKSSYALALYENCSRYRGLPSTKNFQMDVFRKIMGVEDGTYLRFTELRKRVLTPAVDEINAISDIRITPHLIMRGRKTIAIKFSLQEKKIMKRFNIEKIDEPRSDNMDKLNIEKESVIGLSPTEINKLKNRYGETKVAAAIKYVKSTSKYKSGDIQNIGAYLRTAINHDYKIQEETPNKKSVSCKETQEEKKQSLEAKRVDEAKKNYTAYLTNEVFNICKYLPEDTRREIEKAFLTQGQEFHGRFAKNYINNHGGLTNILLYDFYNGGIVAFLLKAYPEILSPIMTEEEYLEQQEELI